jgi:L-aminopeptidase/D-esterase-like protein
VAVAGRSGPHNDLSDVGGMRVGHHQRVGRGWRTGTTVVLCPPGTVAGVDVRGGGPGTRETDLLDPSALVNEVHAICLTGGSAFGLAAADGVMEWLAARHVGFPVGEHASAVVPIVPAAVIFDLGRGGIFANRPDATFGARATAAAGRSRGGVRQGSVGAGAGAVAGGLQGGVGSASLVLDAGSTVAALAVVNASGSVHDQSTGALHAAPLLLRADGRVRRPSSGDARRAADLLAALAPPGRPLNTTIGVVATDAALTKAECTKLAAVAHDGLARAVRPSHGMTDGDTVFGLATGRASIGPAPDVPVRFGDPTARPALLNALLAAAADVFARAVVRAVVQAEGRPDRPAYRELYPSALGRGQT